MVPRNISTLWSNLIFNVKRTSFGLLTPLSFPFVTALARYFLFRADQTCWSLILVYSLLICVVLKRHLENSINKPNQILSVLSYNVVVVEPRCHQLCCQYRLRTLCSCKPCFDCKMAPRRGPLKDGCHQPCHDVRVPVNESRPSR